jgi:uncharacterized membrane protein
MRQVSKPVVSTLNYLKVLWFVCIFVQHLSVRQRHLFITATVNNQKRAMKLFHSRNHIIFAKIMPELLQTFDFFSSKQLIHVVGSSPSYNASTLLSFAAVKIATVPPRLLPVTPTLS